MNIEVLGESHSFTADLIGDLAMVLVDRGLDEEARELHEAWGKPDKAAEYGAMQRRSRAPRARSRASATLVNLEWVKACGKRICVDGTAPRKNFRQCCLNFLVDVFIETLE